MKKMIASLLTVTASTGAFALSQASENVTSTNNGTLAVVSFFVAWSALLFVPFAIKGNLKKLIN